MTPTVDPLLFTPEFQRQIAEAIKAREPLVKPAPWPWPKSDKLSWTIFGVDYAAEPKPEAPHFDGEAHRAFMRGLG